MLNEKLAQKIRKIQILTERATGAEQEEAARQLQKLLTRHNLTPEDVAPLAYEDRPKPTFSRVNVDGVPNSGWRRDLLTGIAHASHGMTIGQGYRGRWGYKGKNSCALVAPKNVLDHLVQMYHYFEKEIEYLAKQEYKKWQNGDVYSWKGPRVYMSSYREGLAKGIASALKDAARAEERQMEAEYTGTSALVLDLDKACTEFVDNTFGPLNYPTRHRQRDYTSYAKGYSEGRSQSLDMHRKVTA